MSCCDKTIDGIVSVNAETVYAETVTVNDQLSLAAGTAADPALNFTGDTDTGVYYDSGVAVAVGGTKRVKIDSSKMELTNRLYMSDGTEALPCITATSDTNTGIYWEAGNQNIIGISTAGIKKLECRGSDVRLNRLMGITSGNAAAPSLYLNNDTDTGIYGAADTMAISLTGTDAAVFNRAGTNSKTTVSQNSTGGHCTYNVYSDLGIVWYELASFDTATVTNAYFYAKVYHHWDFGNSYNIEPLEFQYNYRTGQSHKVMWKQDATTTNPTYVKVYQSGTVHTLYLHTTNFFSGVVEMIYNNAISNLNLNNVGASTPAGSLTYSSANANTWVSTTGTMDVSATTNSTSYTTGALICRGGVGIGADVFTNGSITTVGPVDSTYYLKTDDVTNSTSITTGALISAGGAGIAKTVYIGESAYITGDVDVTGDVIASTGSAAAPSVNFGSTTGFYSNAGHTEVGLSVGGNQKMVVTTSAATFYDSVIVNDQLFLNDGTAALPAMTFTSDLDTGFYRIGANNVGLALAGLNVVNFAATSTNISGDTTNLTLTGTRNYTTADNANYADSIKFIADAQNRYTTSGAVPQTLAQITSKYGYTGALGADGEQGQGKLVLSVRDNTSVTSSTTMTDELTIDQNGVTLATGLLLPTSGGTATLLDYYEEASVTVAMEDTANNDFFTVATNITFYFTQIGNLVTMSWDNVTGTSAGATAVRLLAAIPARFRPNTYNTFGFTVVNYSSAFYQNWVDIQTGGNIYFGNQGRQLTYPTATVISFISGNITWRLN